MSDSKKFGEKNFDGSGVPTRAKLQVKNESRFSTKKSTSFYSEFYADSEYVILSEKYFGQKNGLTATCPLFLYLMNKLITKARNN